MPEHPTFTTLMMSTGLTFGTTSSLYGLNAHIITRTQFSLLGDRVSPDEFTASLTTHTVR
jgi:hypothetical protein